MVSLQYVLAGNFPSQYSLGMIDHSDFTYMVSL